MCSDSTVLIANIQKQQGGVWLDSLPPFFLINRILLRWIPSQQLRVRCIHTGKLIKVRTIFFCSCSQYDVERDTTQFHNKCHKLLFLRNQLIINTSLISKHGKLWLLAFLVAAGREQREPDETLHLRLFLSTESKGTASGGNTEASAAATADWAKLCTYASCQLLRKVSMTTNRY